MAWGGQGVHRAVSRSSESSWLVPTSASLHSEYVASDTNEDAQPAALPEYIERNPDNFSRVAGTEEVDRNRLGWCAKGEGGGEGWGTLPPREGEIAMGSKLTLSSEIRPAMKGLDDINATTPASEVFLTLKKALLTPARIQMTAELAKELTQVKLRPLWGKVNGVLLCELVIQGRFPSAFVPAVAQWAVGQPEWKHACVMYSRLVGYMGRQKDRQGVMETLRMALDSGCELDRIFFSGCIKEMTRLGLNQEAMDLFSFMADKGIKPSSWDCNYQLVACRALRDIRQATKTMEYMRARGVHLDIDHYNVMLDLCGLMKKKRPLDRVVEEIQRDQLRPNLLTYSALVHGYGVLGEFSVVREVLKEMRLRSVKPDTKFYGVLLKSLVEAGKMVDAGNLIGKVKSDSKLPRDVNYYQLLMTWYSHPLRKEDLLETHKVIRASGLKLGPWTYWEVYKRLKAAGEESMAHEMLAEVRKVGHKDLNSPNFNRLRRSLEQEDMGWWLNKDGGRGNDLPGD